MRYVYGFICVLALGAMPVVGCSEEATTPTPDCQIDADCDDQNECTRDRCGALLDDQNEWGWCYYQATRELQWDVCDDGVDDQCTDALCDHGVCTRGTGWLYYFDRDGMPCESDGIAGACVFGECGRECLTDEECDDGIECTWHNCYDSYCVRFSNCDDGNDCTEDLCNRDTDECSYPALPDGTACGGCTRRGSCGWPICALPPCECCIAWAGVCEAGVCLD